MRLALHRGVRVIATAGPTRATALEEIGAQVTGYGDGMAERVAALAADRVDRALDSSPTGGRIDRTDRPSPAGGSLPTLIELTGDPDRVLTVSDFAAAAELGSSSSGGATLEQPTLQLSIITSAQVPNSAMTSRGSAGSGYPGGEAKCGMMIGRAPSPDLPHRREHFRHTAIAAHKRSGKDVEILALRHRITVLERQQGERRAVDRPDAENGRRLMPRRARQPIAGAATFG
ncbi:hypothetical protein AB0K16_25420 [Nonomuraea jabiensis]|uniref:hypothetical protein n=1 Tax=Nonomuraea jabiensis TaxID=882448 RepID=UPI0034316DE9